MPRDYKHRHQARDRQPRRAAPGWMWMLAGLGMGLGVAVAAYVEGRYPGTLLSTGPGLPPVPDATALAATESEPPALARKPRFEFYELLPQAQVQVSEPAAPPRRRPDAEAAQAQANAAQPDAAPTPAVSPPPGEAVARDDAGGQGTPRDAPGYMLQVGSFRDLSDADRLRAELTLNGHDPLIQTVSVNGEGTWHRVRLGPFGDRRSAEQARAALARAQLHSMVLRIRG